MARVGEKEGRIIVERANETSEMNRKIDSDLDTTPAHGIPLPLTEAFVEDVPVVEEAPTTRSKKRGKKSVQS